MKFDTHPRRQEIDDKINALFEQYVPCSGKCDTVGGEIIRAMSRIGYRYYNDGDMCQRGYGCETVNPACRYLIAQGLPLSIWDRYNYRVSEYDYRMYEDFIGILEYLDEHPELFETPNEDDMFDFGDPDEDYDDRW